MCPFGRVISSFHSSQPYNILVTSCNHLHVKLSLCTFSQTRWWQLNDLLFSPLKIGEMIHPFDLRIFVSNGLVRSQQPEKNGPSTKVTLHANFTAPPMAPLQNFKCRTLHEAAQVGRKCRVVVHDDVPKKMRKSLKLSFLRSIFIPTKPLGSS